MTKTPSQFVDKSVFFNNIAYQQCSIEESVPVVSTYFGEHKMSLSSTADSSKCTQMYGLHLNDVAILDLKYGSNVVVYPQVIDKYLVHFSITGKTELLCDKETICAGPGSLVITSPNQLRRVAMHKDSHQLTTAIDTQSLQQYVSNYIGKKASYALEFNSLISNETSIAKSWISTINHLMEHSKLAPQLFSNSVIIQQYNCLLKELLIASFANNYSDKIQNSTDSIQVIPWHIRKAKAFIHANLSETINIAELAGMIGVSVRTLQSGFNAFESMSPLEYIREQRLQRLHHALQQAQPNTSVTELMLSVGITSFGRYAQHYKQRFGCLPSQTIKQ